MLDQLWIATGDGIIPATRPEERALKGYAVRALTRDAQRERWWAIADGRTIMRADGATPEAWREVVQLTDLRAQCLLPLGERLLVGTSDAHLFALDPTGGDLEPIDSFEHAPGRARWYTPWGAAADVRSLAVANGGSWLVNVHVGGVARSRDQGQSWESTMDIDADAHQVLVREGFPRTVAAATARGLALSENGGASWAFHTEGLPATYLRAVAFTKDALVVSASRGDQGKDSALYRRALNGGGEVFERCTEGLPREFEDNINTGSLVARGDFVAAATPEGQVYVSEDGARHWQKALDGLPPIKGLALS